MKKQTKKFTTGLLISLFTLAVGYGVTMLSFNLFGELSVPQMRAVFAADVIALLGVGSAAYLYFENKRVKERRRKELARRHARRVETAEREMKEINKIIFQANKVA